MLWLKILGSYQCAWGNYYIYKVVVFFFVEDSCQISASEDQAEDSIEDDSSHLQKLHSYVTECEENLTKHK